MISLNNRFKNINLQKLMLLGLVLLTSFQMQAAGYFPTETPIEQTTTSVVKKQKTKKWKKTLKKWKQNIRSKNVFGKIALYSFLGASILNFTVVPIYLSGVMGILLLLSLCSAIIGSLGGDENRRNAKMMLFVIGLIFSIIFGWIAIVSF